MRRLLLRFASRSPTTATAARWMASSRVRNYYEVLGVDRNASPADIKRAFYALSKKYHPDVVRPDDQTATAKFLEIKEAYDVLRDDAQRHDYDLQLDGGYGHYGPSSSSSSSSDVSYYRHVRRPPPPPAGSGYTQEDFHRIWRAMQNNAEFQRATHDFNEYLRSARERAYDDQQRRRDSRFKGYSEEEIRKRPFRGSFGASFPRRITREWTIVHHVLSAYFALFVLASLYQYFRPKPPPPFQEPLPVPKSSYDRISEMINRPPRY